MKLSGIKIVDIEKIPGVPELDAGSAQAVASLQHHPGFQYLSASLRYQRSLLEAALKKSRHKDIRDVEFLQSGISWCEWLDAQITKAVGIVQRPVARPAKPVELAQFEQLLSQIDVVGAGSQTTTSESQ